MIFLTDVGWTDVGRRGQEGDTKGGYGTGSIWKTDRSP